MKKISMIYELPSGEYINLYNISSIKMDKYEPCVIIKMKWNIKDVEVWLFNESDRRDKTKAEEFMQRLLSQWKLFLEERDENNSL